ncbi:MAG TPA: hypothetical protein VFW87_06665 [Pirellulales bacterium]|nr:hypothetical protein [Pirellulales bacterium]
MSIQLRLAITVPAWREDASRCVQRRPVQALASQRLTAEMQPSELLFFGQGRIVQGKDQLFRRKPVVPAPSLLQ